MNNKIIINFYEYGKVIYVTVITVDFDGTLYKGNSFNAMFQLAQKEFTIKEWLVVGQGVVISAFAGLLKGKEALRKQFFLSFVRSFKGRTEQELDDFFEKLVEIGKADINWPLVDKIQEHQNNGDKIIIVSGALHPFLQEFIKEVNLDVPIISTEILYDENRICTGDIHEYINGEQKVRHIQKWMKSKSIEEDTSVWAYADSKSDLPLFRFANHPVVVNPNKEMAIIADQYQWQVFR